MLIILFTLCLCVSSEELTAIPLGLFSSEIRDSWSYTLIQNLTCQEFIPGVEESCKYYGDCCKDPMRIRERLLSGTFTCSDEGLYVVNRCPLAMSDQYLTDMCENEWINGTDLSLMNWKVYGTYTHVTYRNIYCAICNGALEYKMEEQADVPPIRFWTAEIGCDNETIQNLTENNQQLNLSVIVEAITQRGCVYNMAADIKTHRCRPGVMNHCPDGYLEEIKNLCENGPVGTMRTCDGIFRNEFCALCWKEYSLESLGVPTQVQVSPPLPTELQGTSFSLPEQEETLVTPPPLTKIIRLTTASLLEGIPPPLERGRRTTCDWTDTPIEAVPSYQLNRYRQLLTLQPQLQTHDKPKLLLSDLVEQNADDIILSLTNDLQTKYAYTTTINSTKPIKAWDLGSLRCHSGFDNVCHNFVRFPDYGCGGPGCGASSVEDILNDACIQLDNTTSKIYNQTEIEAARKNSHFTRPRAVYEKYYGSELWEPHCESADQRCHYFGDCCSDFGAGNLDPPLEYSCETFDSSSRYGFRIISTCPTGSDEMCDDGGNWRVFDQTTGLSYKNMDCALCNDATPENLLNWAGIMDCQPEGLCTVIDFAMPKLLDGARMDKYHICDQGFISTCPPHLSDWAIANDCKTGPVSTVFYQNSTYRNSYCAICNLGDEVINTTLLGNYPQNWMLKGAEENFVHRLTEKMNRPIALFEKQDDKVNCCRYCESIFSCVFIEMSEEFNLAEPLSINASRIMVSVCLLELNCKEFKRLSMQPPQPFIPFPPSRSRTSFGGQPSGNPVGLPAILLFFGFGDESSGDTLSNQSVTTESATLCADGTIRAQGQGYAKLRLGPAAIKVEQPLDLPPQLSSFAIYDYILIAISLVSIVICIIYLLCRANRNLHTAMIIILLICIFGATLLFALSPLMTANLIGCKVIAGLIQFFYISTVTWSNVIGINIYRMVITVTAADRSDKKSLLLYGVYAFGIPLGLTVAAGIVDALNASSLPIYRTSGLCFLNSGNVPYLLGLFLIPIYAGSLIGIICGSLSMGQVMKSPIISSNDEHRSKRNALTCIKMALVLGFTWVLFPFLLIEPTNSPAAIGYSRFVMVILDLQGLFVVIATVVTWSCLRRCQTETSTLSQQPFKGSSSQVLTEMTRLSQETH